MKVEVKDGKKDKISLEIKECNLEERNKLNKHLWKLTRNDEDGPFWPSVNILRLTTDLTDEEINAYSNDVIFRLAIAISNTVNKKKEI